MSLFQSLFEFFLRASPVLGMVAVSGFLYLIVDHTSLDGGIKKPTWSDRKIPRELLDLNALMNFFVKSTASIIGSRLSTSYLRRFIMMTRLSTGWCWRPWMLYTFA